MGEERNFGSESRSDSVRMDGKILVLNDQGGGIMNVSYDVVSTLRAQTKHHEPIVLLYEKK